METSNAKRQARAPRPRVEFENAAWQSTMPEESSTSAFVAMVATNVILLLMLAA
jgi:hypothetical protein